ncbi:MAG TPA: hypothetical protein DCL38_03245, partial [Lachnospiraceae bacterium]|nr:hypothetical protein [Lachnospiraceae bacterium]
MKDFKTIVRLYRCFKYIMSRKQRKQAAVVLLLILIGSFLELLGVSVILPFIQAFLEPEKLMSKWYVRYIDSILHIRDQETLL